MLYPIDHVLAGWKNLKKAERTTNHLIFCELDKFLGGNEQLKLQCNASINKSRSIELAEVECVLSGARSCKSCFTNGIRCEPPLVRSEIGRDLYADISDCKRRRICYLSHKQIIHLSNTKELQLKVFATPIKQCIYQSIHHFNHFVGSLRVPELDLGCSCQAAEVCSRAAFPQAWCHRQSAVAHVRAMWCWLFNVSEKTVWGWRRQAQRHPLHMHLGCKVKCKRDTVIQTRITCNNNLYDLLF